MIKLERQQILPIDKQRAWQFFSHPANLNIITPPSMHFEILTELPDKITEGLTIDYRISPLPLISMKWKTLITEVEEKERFADVQLNGPYQYWKHVHLFEDCDSGTLMTDKLEYNIGKSFLGWIAGKLWVHQQVESIFDYRYRKLEELFKAD